MKIWIVYREDAYQGYSVRKIFSSYEKASNFVESEPAYERGLLSIEEDEVE